MKTFLCPHIKIFYTLQTKIIKCKKSLYGDTLKKELGEYEPKANEKISILVENLIYSIPDRFYFLIVGFLGMLIAYLIATILYLLIKLTQHL